MGLRELIRMKTKKTIPNENRFSIKLPVHDVTQMTSKPLVQKAKKKRKEYNMLKIESPVQKNLHGLITLKTSFGGGTVTPIAKIVASAMVGNVSHAKKWWNLGELYASFFLIQNLIKIIEDHYAGDINLSDILDLSNIQEDGKRTKIKK